MARNIKISEIVENTVSNYDGEKVFSVIYDILQKNEKVNISFDGIYALNTSFINSAFIELLEHFSFDFIKSNLMFSNSTNQINSAILSRFHFEVNKKSNKIVS